MTSRSCSPRRELGAVVMNARPLLRVTAVLEAATALGFLLAPALVVTNLFRPAPTSAAGLLVARIVGAPLLSLSIACWFAAGETAARGPTVLIAAMLLYDAVAALLLLYAALAYGLVGIGLWPVVIAHLALAARCVAGLQQLRSFTNPQEAASRP